MSKLDITLNIALAMTMVVSGVACLLACMQQDFPWALNFLMSGIGCGLVLWVFACPKDEPVDPCIPEEWASEGVLEAGMILGEIHPADWQLEEIMTIRLEAYLNRTWKQLHDEWGYDPADVRTYDDGLVTGFAMATRQIACHFDIKLEKP